MEIGEQPKDCCPQLAPPFPLVVTRYLGTPYGYDAKCEQSVLVRSGRAHNIVALEFQQA